MFLYHLPSNTFFKQFYSIFVFDCLLFIQIKNFFVFFFLLYFNFFFHNSAELKH